MFQILSLPQIRRWLAGCIRHTGSKIPAVPRDGPTMRVISRYTGIPKNSLEWLARKDTAIINPDKIRIISKMIAEIENGVLDFQVIKGKGRAKVAVRLDKPGDRPRVRQRYQVSVMAKAAPRLAALDRPRLPGKMPTMQDLMGGPLGGELDKRRGRG